MKSAVTATGRMRGRPQKQRFDIRFVAIWIAFGILLLVSALLVPRSLLPSSFLPILPLAAFLAICSMGEAIVLMVRGIDLSIPAVIILSSSILIGISGGQNDQLWNAITLALLCSLAVGLLIGILVAVVRLNPLIVTLAVSTILTGVMIWYREGVAQEASVPPILADWGGRRFMYVNSSVWLTLCLIVALTFLLRQTILGRRFVAVGANPRAARVAGLRVTGYQVAAYALAGLLYGIAGVLLSAFIRNPTLDVGSDYLLAPIAAAVLAGTAVTGGIGSMIAVAGAALFLTQLGQILRMLDISTAIQFIINGIAIAVGMGLAGVRLGDVWSRIGGRRQRRRFGEKLHPMEGGGP